MNKKLQIKIFIFFLFFSCSIAAQDVTLFQQFNGRFDFTFIGNTLNTSENNLNNSCTILTESSASLTLNASDEIQKAYLYWAGSGTGDLDILLNQNAIHSERTFSFFQNNLDYFCAFADVTNLVLSQGNGNYHLSEFDVSPFLNQNAYCNNRTNFAGWAIIIIYKNDSLPLNQLNVYDGLQGVSRTQQNLRLTLNSLNVIDNHDAKIGFVAWEGDKNLSENETLQINGHILSNTLNPRNNAFNGTNTIRQSDTLYNMDLDVYDIQDHIAIGNPTAEIRMTSGADFVMISSIVTKLNSQLPDATIALENIQMECNSRRILVNYTVYNLESTNLLVSGVPISIYVNNNLIGNTQTTGAIPIGGSQSSSISITIPDNIPDNFTIKFVVDDIGNETGIITEINENNNSFSYEISLLVSPKFNLLPTLYSCNQGLRKGVFDFSDYEELVKTNQQHEVSFFESYEDAIAYNNPILNSHNYTAEITPKEIFIRINDENCFSITSFFLETRNCKPTIYNAVTYNNDGLNEYFQIDGLRDIFMNFKLFIYNRWGTLIWKGDQYSENWYGQSSEGIHFNGNQVPGGTYFYILELNDPDFPSPVNGWVYLTR